MPSVQFSEDTKAGVSGEKLAEDRKNYYDKWNSFTKEELTKAEQEELEEKKAADAALGRDKNEPKSEAEKADREKMQALKEAKKQWEQKKVSEASMKFLVENLDGVERVLDSVKLKWKPVIFFKNNKNCKLKIPHNLKHKLIKIFVEDCENCQIDIETTLITQHIEVAHCTGCKIVVKEFLATMQVDLCKDLHVWYRNGIFTTGKTKIFHAGVEDLKVELEGKDVHKFTYSENLLPEDKLPLEVQFLTHLPDGELRTEKVLRDKGNLPATKEEMEEQELQMKDMIRQAELQRIGGNEAFKEMNYSQAAIYYTEAIDTIERTGADRAAECDFLHICYANRAFCWQKLGHHEKAEEDAKRCLNIQPDYVKGLFRLGLALHAQKKYFEALPILGKAHELEPKNEQIKQALGFCEIQMRKIMQSRD